jgi:hypothetical protein
MMPNLLHSKAKWPVIAIVSVAVVAGVFSAIAAFRRAPAAPVPSSNNSAEAPVEPAVTDKDAYRTIVVEEADIKYTEAAGPVTSVSNLAAVEKAYGLKLKDAQEKYLETNRFLLVDAKDTVFAEPSWNFDEMLNDQDAIGGRSSPAERKPENAKLVTPDAVLHAYHRFFELTLEKLEQGELADELGVFLRGLHGNIVAAAGQSSGQLQVRYQELQAQTTVALALLENKSPAQSEYGPAADAAYAESDKAVDTAARAKTIAAKYAEGLPVGVVERMNQEIDSIYAAEGLAKDPLFDQYHKPVPGVSHPNDYTQYTPRSHYTKNSALRAYFRTMMYLGRSSYSLSTDLGIGDTNLLVRQMAKPAADGTVPLDAWKRIMAVTGFYAGQSDDLTYAEWRVYENEVLGSAATADAGLIAPATISKLAADLDRLRLPRIFSEIVIDPGIGGKTKADLLRDSLGFRVFGQRFTFDAWILNDLTAGQESTPTRLPSMPSALFVPAALGDERAASHVNEFLANDAKFKPDEIAGFGKALAAKRGQIAKVTPDEWWASLGSSWLHVLGSFTRSFGPAYPAYMRATAFADKQIQTFLGSYAELKHDTLLYAKQSYAELGGGPGDDKITPVVRGFVEPNIEFWNRLNLLIDRTEALFVANGVFEDDIAMARLHEFRDLCRFYARLAEQELLGEAISDEDYEKLRTTDIGFIAAPFDGGEPDADSARTALIADIHTDVLGGRILYEATGQPMLMLALVGNENDPRAVAGMVYRHYELTGPLGGNRLTDEDWRKRVYGQPGNLPPVNFWYDSLKPESIAQ